MEEHPAPLRGLLAAGLAAIIVGGTIDLILDRPESWLSAHVAFEALLVLGAVALAVYLWIGWWRAENAADRLRRSLVERQHERDAWRASARVALEGLGAAVDRQFSAWKLTPAEREVALLLLKGHSHKQIAHATGRNERTARQHASAIYQKAGLAGRAELAAFFFEDLMLPAADRPTGPLATADDPGGGLID